MVWASLEMSTKQTKNDTQLLPDRKKGYSEFLPDFQATMKYGDHHL